MSIQSKMLVKMESERIKTNLENARLALACANQELDRTDEDDRREVETMLNVWRKQAFLYRASSRDLALRILAAGTAVERWQK